MKYKNYLLLTFFSSFLFSCSSKSNCENSVGYWEMENPGYDVLKKFTITEQDGKYIFKSLNFDRRLGKNYITGLPCENNKLVLRGIAFINELDFLPIEDGEKLLFGGNTYRRKDIEKTFMNDKFNAISDSTRASYYRIRTYKNGILEEKVKDYYLDGTLQFEGNFNLENKLEGVKKVFYRNGNIKEESNWENGKLKSIKKYDLNAKELNIGTFKDGSGIVLLYDENNNVVSSNLYNNGKLESTTQYKMLVK